MKKIYVVIGTRPEAIKMGLLVKHLKQTAGIECTLIVTAQHRSMLDSALEIFGITADIDLNLMTKNQTLSNLTTLIIKNLASIFYKKKPDLVIVQGDTTTTLASALAAFYQKIPVAHVEAGLRTWDKYSPFPEEINRRLTDEISYYHFAPTLSNKENLVNENIPKENIYVTGNTAIDALFYVHTKVKKDPPHIKHLDTVILARKYILVTAHRRENFGLNMKEICRSINYIAAKFPDIAVIFPVHKNPNVQNVVQKHVNKLPNIHLIPPLNYESFVYLMSNSYLILTDSGGIQEEAPSLGIPVLVLRDVTERKEAVKAGTVNLVGTNYNKIIEEAITLITDDSVYQKMASIQNPYGDGTATQTIIKILLEKI